MEALNDLLQPIMKWIMIIVGGSCSGLVLSAIILRGMQRFIRFIIRCFSRIESNSEIRSDGNNGAPDTVITLVHGTWARDAVWTLPSSFLCGRFREQLGEKVLIRRFQWSGKNSIRARNVAAKALSNELRSLLQRYPTASHFSIGHSHGGSVILEALDEEIATGLAGVVCIATPVLVVKRRSFDPWTERCLQWAPLLMIVALSLLTVVWTDAKTLGAKALVLYAVSGIALFLWVRVFKSGYDALNALVGQNPTVDPNKVIFVRAPGDEASMVLMTSQMFHWLVQNVLLTPVNALWGAHEQLQRWSWYLKKYLWATAIAFFGCIYLMYLGWHHMPPLVFATFIPGALGVIVIFLVFNYSIPAFSMWTPVLAFAFIGPLTLIVGLFGLAVGPELAFTAMHFEVTAETTPPGDWRVVLVRTAEARVNTREPVFVDMRGVAPFQRAAMHLQHSEIYDTPEAIDRVCNWISEKCARA
jgi:hypothetical protein